MRLEKRYIDVQKVVFDGKTFIEKGVLHISKEELSEVAKDSHFESIDFELAYPGESCRLSSVGDCVQPMYKPGENAATFPGFIDGMKRVGEGVSIFLRGVSVTETLLMPMVIESTLDMTGPAAELSLVLPKQIHICILAKPAENVKLNDYYNAVNVASKKVAKYLAKCAADSEVSETEVFEMQKDGLEKLPKVTYIFQMFSHAPLTDTVYYGDGCASMMPIIVHPNEILDGALLCRDYWQVPNASPTFCYQNHHMILELLRRHGKDINLVGVIMSNAPAEVENKRRNAMMCASLAKYTLNADCAIITKEGGGHPQIDVGLTCDCCEEIGVKTVLMLSEFLSEGNPIDELTLFSTPNANAMVTTGCLHFLNYPKVERVIGLSPIKNSRGDRIMDLNGEITKLGAYTMTRDFVSQIGNTRFSSEVY